MDLKAYVLYDEKTGDILHTYLESTDSPFSGADFLRQRGSDGAAGDCAILECRSIELRAGMRVDLKRRTLEVVDEQAASGGGGSIESDDELPVEPREVVWTSKDK